MSKEYFRRLGRLCAIMLHAGSIGFGGGSALIPVLEEQVVQRYHLVEEEEFNKDVVVASITPGALPVEIAAGVGRKVAGLPGMLLSAGAMAFPGVLMTVVTSSLLARFGSAITRQLSFVAVGITAYIIYILFCYTRDTVKEAKGQGKYIPCLITIGLVFFFTCGKSLQQIFDMDHSPIFAVSTVNVMAVALFLVFFLRGHYHWGNTLFAFGLSIVYLLSVGKSQLLDSALLTWSLRLLMVGLSIWGVRREVRREGQSIRVDWIPALKECGCWLLFLAVLSVPTLFTFDGALDYISRGALSTVISFGGGDAYLAVAGGMFVTSGVVLSSDFYTNLVPTANAFPGSILSKVLAATGYFAAYRATDSYLAGYLAALCGYGVSVAVSGCTFSLVACLYERFENTNLFAILKEVIRPIISGLLLTVCLSFYYSCINTGAQARWPDVCAPALCAALAVGCHFYVRRWGHRPLLMVVGCGVLAFLMCNLFSLL